MNKLYTTIHAHNKLLKILFYLLIYILAFVPNAYAKNATNFSGNFEKGRLRFIYDLTFKKDGRRFYDLKIIEEELKLIKSAEQFIIADMFLFNNMYDMNKMIYPGVANEITRALIETKKQKPQIDIIFITDPWNNGYGSFKEIHMEQLRQNGIITVVTDLNKMSDSNPLYSIFYRTFMQWFEDKGPNIIPNIIDPTAPDIKLTGALKLLNLKANHRKTLSTDKGAIITSANPHDPSFYNSNIAVFIESPIINDIIKSEQRVANFSGVVTPKMKYVYKETINDDSDRIRLITENAIKKALLNNISRAGKNDNINIGIFYISDYGILKALAEASDRGANIKIVADPNKDAFGMKKNGRPNREALTSLKHHRPNINIRWYNTTGEQFHTKMAFFEYKEENRVILGSANFTRRNLDGFNLETDVEIVTSKSSKLSNDITTYFKKIWNNVGGDFTSDYHKYRKQGVFPYMIYRTQEETGLCSW